MLTKTDMIKEKNDSFYDKSATPNKMKLSGTDKQTLKSEESPDCLVI